MDDLRPLPLKEVRPRPRRKGIGHAPTTDEERIRRAAGPFPALRKAPLAETTFERSLQKRTRDQPPAGEVTAERHRRITATEEKETTRRGPHPSAAAQPETVTVDRTPIKRHYARTLSLIALGFVLLLIVWVAQATGAPLFPVLFGFYPILLFVISVIILIDRELYNLLYIGLIGGVLLVSFVVVANTPDLAVARGVDLWSLFAWNLVFSAVYFLLLVIPTYLRDNAVRKARPAAARRTVEERIHERREVTLSKSEKERKAAPGTPESIITTVHSLEDRCKAINFVIGRVYNKYHGGTKDLREMVNIPNSWYDDFNNLRIEDIRAKPFKRRMATELIGRIRDRLLQLERSESEVFGDTHRSLRHLTRAQDGSNRIIEVLERNDKDPIRTYHEGALSFCTEVLSELKGI
ncbi:hypothetical protein JXB02_00875 [Candidatus Woesearchaeota archaeon]|nr:hypothetical protein [Candidatus Woesearchaeota archaeon]